VVWSVGIRSFHSTRRSFCPGVSGGLLFDAWQRDTPKQSFLVLEPITLRCKLTLLFAMTFQSSKLLSSPGQWNFAGKASFELNESNPQSSYHCHTTRWAPSEQFTMLKSENCDFCNRHLTLFENANRQHIRTQAVEDLVEPKGLVESLQKDNSNFET
jgi:hypothetical protein